MKYIKKFAAFLLVAILITAVAACDFESNDGGGGGTAQINGAVNLQVPYKCADYDFLAGVSAADSTITVDKSAVDFNKLGTYEITYGISGTSITKKVNVEVVLGTQKSIAENDIALLEQLRGEEISDVEKGLIYTVAALRAENYNVVLNSDVYYNNGIENFEEMIQDTFLKDLSDMEIALVKLYLVMWFDAFNDNTNTEITDGDKRRMYYSFMLGRSFTEDEEKITDDIADIAERFEAEEEYFNFIEAESELVAATLQLTDDEIAANDLFKAIKYEIIGKEFMLDLTSDIGIELNNEQINAFFLMMDVLYTIEFPLPPIQNAQETLEKTFTDEQIVAYNIVLELQGLYFLNEYSEFIESEPVWGREITDADKPHLINCILIIELEYKNESDEFVDIYDDFFDLTVSEIETEIERELSELEIESIFYVKTQNMIAMLKATLNRELEDEEIEAVPVIVRLWEEYDSNKEETELDMSETQTNEEIEEVLKRDLNADEIAALVYFRSIIAEMNPTV
ncbi:MAG: hypothetical protein PHE12_04670 [Clostridia bacterium]|nr:hypothetical protein [Clostridia bacterium]